MDPLTAGQNPPPTVPVKRSSKGGVIMTLLIVGIIATAILLIFVLPEYQRSKVLKNGIQAEGTITAIAPTGNYYNDQPEAAITVDVRPTSTGQQATFTTTIRHVVNPIYSPLFQPGKKVLIRYLPEDSSKAAIEYAQGN